MSRAPDQYGIAAPNLFDAAEAEARRDAAIQQVTDNATREWLTSAIQAVELCAKVRDYFSTDHVWEALDAAGIEPPHEPKAMAAAMLACARRGLIVKTNTTEKSRRPECHRRDIAVWRSVARTTGLRP